MLQPCDGLAPAMDHCFYTEDATKIIALCARRTASNGLFGTQTGRIDMLVPRLQALILRAGNYFPALSASNYVTRFSRRAGP